MDHLARELEYTELPRHNAFYSRLKMTNINGVDYLYCEHFWREQCMQSFRNLLEWYNNRDVVSFLEPQVAFYREQGNNMLKVGFSIPGLTL